jgi:Protein of unknown function (DUF2510)/Phospholipase_D-nuclease N-terminal
MDAGIAGPSMLSLELVTLIVGVATIAAAVDIIRQPGWAWRRADENKIAYLVLVVLVPVVGLSLYVFKGRPRVAPVAAAGRAASLPFERFGEPTEALPVQHHQHWPVGEVSAPVRFDLFRVTRGTGADAAELPEERPFETSGTFFSAPTATKTRTASRTYRPKQRTSLAPNETTATVPAGWKADPTGRHQFRYWDGSGWTENVADEGDQSRDAISA